VVSVTDGVVRALKSGQAEITAARGATRASLNVLVSIPVSVAIKPNDLDLFPSVPTAQLQIRAKDELGKWVPNPKGKWTSSDEGVVTVVNGKVTAVKPGAATIHLELNGLQAEARVRVRRLGEFARLAVSPAKHVLDPNGGKLQLRAQMFDVDGRSVDEVRVTWATSHPNVVTVDESGVATAHAPGRALITAIAGPRKASSEIDVREEPQGTGGSGPPDT
jgi:uncharacterized protein YjdB